MIKVFEHISNIFAFANTRDNLPKVLKVLSVIKSIDKIMFKIRYWVNACKVTILYHNSDIIS